MPEIIFKGTNGNNYWPGRAGHAIVGICNHIMQGTEEGTDGVFKNPQWGASADYGVAKDGRIWQWVKDEDSAWAEGILNNPDLNNPLIAEIVQRRDNPNYYFLSIEHEGRSGEQLTEAQYQSTLWLHKHLIALHNLKADRTHIVGHYQFDSVSRAACPGPAFPWDRLLKDLQTVQPGPPLIRSRMFPDTGFCINDPFLSFYEAHGGIEVLGLPVKPEEDAKLYNLGFEGTVQWCERSRLEFHNADGKFYLGLVGSELLSKV